MAVLRFATLALVLLIAISIQDAALQYGAISGVVPNLALLVVVAVAVERGSDYGAGAGLLAGLLLDMVPPASGIAGRWALALVVVGYLAGKVSSDARRSRRALLAVVAGCSFVATSVFALSGVILGQTTMEATRMPVVIILGTIVDALTAVILVPPMMAGIRRLRPARALT